MICADRKGNRKEHSDMQDKVLSFLYLTVAGRVLVRPLITPWVSKTIGKFMDTPISKGLISSFVKKNNIDLSEYDNDDFDSYNDFFTRKIKEGRRLIDYEPKHLIAPCDAKLSVYPITKDSYFKIKHTVYSMRSLLRSEKLAKFYENGTIMIFRLTVDDYHRFCYMDDGRKTRNYHIPGVFHTVNPISNDVYPIYKENTREFSLLKSKNFGSVLMMEVGAMLVGKIVNYHQEASVKRGQEKGTFEFGGSTVILCFQDKMVDIDKDIYENSQKGIETIVKMGEKIGRAKGFNE